jgi:hypothetical protein
MSMLVGPPAACARATDIDVNPTVTMHAATKLMYLIIMNASSWCGRRGGEQQTNGCLTPDPAGGRQTIAGRKLHYNV